ncbi:hypothetical protein M0D45_12695 [Xanthomonas prunicola]|uniref:hypothetical protein n=1 Tax=Xanthomonas prunicola TaxID=2053930 RepID=UPI0021B19D59|nr:hypothetical protein [Xanthomonas prunicola]UXA51598.1 hypothetical protein M0D45_12695 [Xanthomonas prunicola]
MKREPKDWHLQLVWFIAGIFATGAVWYFISTGKSLPAVLSGLAAFGFALFAIYLHRARDQASESKSRERIENGRLHGEIRLAVGEELITFNELERTTDFDIVKVNTSHHFIGVASEHRWIEHRYQKRESYDKPSPRWTDFKRKILISQKAARSILTC